MKTTTGHRPPINLDEIKQEKGKTFYPVLIIEPTNWEWYWHRWVLSRHSEWHLKLGPVHVAVYYSFLPVPRLTRAMEDLMKRFLFDPEQRKDFLIAMPPVLRLELYQDLCNVLKGEKDDAGA